MLKSTLCVSLIASVVYTTLNVRAVVLLTSASFILRRESSSFYLDTLLTYLLIHSLTHSMEQSPSCEANWFCS